MATKFVTPIKWTRTRSNIPLRVRESRNTERGLYSQGKRTDYLIVPVLDSWDMSQIVGWDLVVNPGTHDERTYGYVHQRNAKECAAMIEAR